MASISIPLPEPAAGQEDHLALAAEFQQLSKDVIRSNEIERKLNAGEQITDEESLFLDGIPEKMRRACDITRILRRTNTGPAKVKEKATRTSRAKASQAEIDKLIDM